MSKASFFAVAAVCTLGACRNGPKNYRDSTGFTGNSAAGQIAPGTGSTGGATVDSTGTGAAATTGTGVAGGAVPGVVKADTATLDTSKKAKKYP